jgi:hypothetical protein
VKKEKDGQVTTTTPKTQGLASKKTWQVSWDSRQS